MRRWHHEPLAGRANGDMRRPHTLPAFTTEQYQRAHTLLAGRVATMMGRKLEEGDWAVVYCASKGIPNRGWSNLQIDVLFNGLGVEHKMLRRSSDIDIRSACGMRLMHPSATRSIRVPDGDANDVMREVLSQYADLVETRRLKVLETSPDGRADLRTGWLLWQSDLTEFLYFEEEALAPNSVDYSAEWRDSGGGARKASRNLWVYERETGQKRFSVTTTAGAKIQPYFDVPPPDDPNLYYFRVQGEEIGPGLVRIWITPSTERELLQKLDGRITPASIEELVRRAAAASVAPSDTDDSSEQEAHPLILTVQTYQLLESTFTATSDEHRMRLMLQRIELIS